MMSHTKVNVIQALYSTAMRMLRHCCLAAPESGNNEIKQPSIMKTTNTPTPQPSGGVPFLTILWKRTTGLFLLLNALLFLTLSAHAQTQPPNTLSITSYGASTGSSDNTTAIQNCINAAQTQGKGVWIPAGTWKIQGALNATGILIAGAGMTSSIIYRQQNSGDVTATQLGLFSCTVQDIGIDGNGTSRGVNASYGINMKGVGWLIQRVQIHHSDAGIWASGSSGTVQNCVLNNTFADGVNINNSGTSASQAGANLTIQNCTQTSSGDDGFAINSQGRNEGWPNMVNAKIFDCTSIGAFAANGIRIAGGTNSVVANNLVTNAYQSDIICGIFGGENSDGQVVSNAVITGNVCYGGGTNNDNEAGIRLQDNSVANVSGNTILNTIKYGITVADGGYHLANNTIIHPGLTGVWIESGAKGAAVIQANEVRNLNSGQTAFVNSASGTFSTTLTGNSWQSSAATFSSGTFTTDAVLSLIGADPEELYGVTLGDTSAQWTANGYSFGPYPSAHITYGGSGAYAVSGFLGGGGTSGDASFNTILNNAELGINNGVITLQQLTSGATYSVMFLEADTRSGVGSRTFQMTTTGASSPNQSYAFQGGTPALGGYIMCTFTASGSTQTFTNTAAGYGYQLNAVLVEQQ